MAREEPETKKFKASVISDHVYCQQFQDLFSEHWHENKPLEAEDIEIITYPFRVCRISNFIKDESFMDEMKTEISEVKSRRMCIDLYQFEQTGDLANTKDPHLKSIYETFQTDLTSWMERNTEIDLNRKISMSSACYYDTDFLLCHDDNLGDRRIAYILYLSKDWTEDDGGTLDLFDVDEKGRPRRVVKSLLPEYNSLVFFEVADNSFHQVAEVTAPDKARWSLNGWFHGPVRSGRTRRKRGWEAQYLKPEETYPILEPWVKETYLRPDIVKQIQTDIEHKSYTFLSEFVKPEKYGQLSEDVLSKDIVWKSVGPADVRNYEVADEETLPETMKEFYSMFKSIVAFKLFKAYTELDLEPDLEAGINPKMTIELQRWSKGCYNLICDKPAGYNSDKEEDNLSCKEEEEETNSSKDDDTNSSKESDNSSKEDESDSSKEEEEEELPPPKEVVIEVHVLPEDAVFDVEIEDEELEGEEEVEEENYANYESPPEGGQSPPEGLLLSPPPTPPSPQTPPPPVSARNSYVSARLRREQTIPQGSSSSASNEEHEEDLALSRILRRRTSRKLEKRLRSLEEASCSKFDEEEIGGECSPSGTRRVPPINPDSEDPEVSDIGDYLSDHNEPPSGENSEAENADADDEDEVEPPPNPKKAINDPGSLDVMIQFSSGTAPKDCSIDYIDTRETDAALIHVPYRENHLCIVYKTCWTCRIHRYVSYYSDKYFYSLICTYYE